MMWIMEIGAIFGGCSHVPIEVIGLATGNVER